MLGLSDLGLHRSDLALGRILAVGDVFVERVDDRLKLFNAADHVLVVAGHKGIDCFGRAFKQAILVTDAAREGIEVFFSSELVDQASRDTGNFLACEVRLVRESWPVLVTSEGRLLLGEESSGECLAGFLIFACVVHLHDLTICGVSMDTERCWLNIRQTLEFSHPVVRLPQQVEQGEGFFGDESQTAATSEELAHVFTVHDFEDSDCLSAVLDIFSDDELGKVVETLLVDEGVPGSPGKNDLVVVWAVGEHFRTVR